MSMDRHLSEFRPMLNDVLNEAVAMVQPPTDRDRRLRSLYNSNRNKAPSFISFANNVELLHYSYVRYLENQLSSFGFEERQ